MKEIIGKFQAINKRGGFVRNIEDEDVDVFIPSRFTNTAMHGDIVVVKITKQAKPNVNRHPEGEIVAIKERAITKVTGRVDRSKKSVFVIADSPKVKTDIFIPKGKAKGAKNGDKVVVNIEKYPTNDASPEGVIVKILNKDKRYSTDVLSILEEFDITHEFSDDSLNQAKNIPQVINEKDLCGRKDFRDQLVITIDGDDTKDVDDACYLEKIEEGYRLYIHIADVSEYVGYNSPLDKDARLRSTSVYLVREVVPMLPKELSNGICSLNEGVDRYCLSCIMDIDNNGKIISSKIEEGIIKVDHHMTYNQVQAIFDNDYDVIEKFKDVVPMLKDMKILSEKIDILREKNGNIDFDTDESKFIFNKKGKLVDIIPYPRMYSQRVIENFMIYANESVSTEYFWRDIPFLYRVHEEPSEDKINELSTVLKSVGIITHFTNNVYSGQLKKIIDSVQNTPIQNFVNEVILRSMMRAKYDVTPIGHFGLGLRYYSHFTSPIRRYADLQIHRIIKENIHGKIDINHYAEILPEIAKHISSASKRADDCEREFDKIQKIKFMGDKIGEVYSGIINSITRFGIYVSLPNTVEGMIKIRDMEGDDYYFDSETNSVIGHISGRTYKIGDNVKIEVEDVSLRNRHIDFILVNEDEDDKK